jgi:hypothetical protein
MKKILLSHLLPAGVLTLLAFSALPSRADEAAPAPTVGSLSDAGAPSPDSAAKDGADAAQTAPKKGKKKHKKKHKASAAPSDGTSAAPAAADPAPMDGAAK